MGDKQDLSPQEKALFNAIKEKRKDDPLIGAKLGGQDILDRLIGVLKNDKGVHIETLLTIIGALGGYACHSAVREALVDTGQLPENQVFTILSGADGNKYYLGDYVNRPLAEDQFSFWGLVAGEAKHFGAVALPDIAQINGAVAKTLGSDKFGIPNVPENHRVQEKPIDFLKALWKQVNPVVERYIESPVEKPILFGLAAQKAIEMSKDIIPPEMAAQVLMESAVPMSRIGPEWLK